uniref:hypothetical protein n=1 Tax=Halococcus hamelinensis TaxID=332168 RepID=UPI001ED98085
AVILRREASAFLPRIYTLSPEALKESAIFTHLHFPVASRSYQTFGAPCELAFGKTGIPSRGSETTDISTLTA